VRPLPQEDHSPTACNGAGACPTLRPRMRGLYHPAPGNAPVRAHAHTGLRSRLAPQRVGPLYGEAIAGLGCADRGLPAIRDTTVDTVFTKRAADGSLWQACIARVAHRAAAKHREVRVLHGDGTNAVATKGAMALDRRETRL
jgi:hypothetical protein